jgi:hypothetical protein
MLWHRFPNVIKLLRTASKGWDPTTKDRGSINEKAVPSILTPDLENTANKTQNGTHGSSSTSVDILPGQDSATSFPT